MNQYVRDLLDQAQAEYARALAHQRRGFELEEQAIAILREETERAYTVSEAVLAHAGTPVCAITAKEL